jgi:hypothetical protein
LWVPDQGAPVGPISGSMWVRRSLCVRGSPVGPWVQGSLSRLAEVGPCGSRRLGLRVSFDFEVCDVVLTNRSPDLRVGGPVRGYRLLIRRLSDRLRLIADRADGLIKPEYRVSDHSHPAETLPTPHVRSRTDGPEWNNDVYNKRLTALTLVGVAIIARPVRIG